jgi:phosphatidylglycerophosphate synthase
MSEPAASLPPTRRHGPREIVRHFRTVPNQLTGLRLLLLPVLWLLAVLGLPFWVGVGLALAGLTDVLDGYLSRRWKQTSEFGSRLDSVADHLIAISTPLWLVMGRPFLFHEQKWPLIIWSAFALLVLLVHWVRFRRFVDLHLPSAKVAVFMAFMFALPLLILGRYSRIQFGLAWLACMYAAAEALWAVLRREKDGDERGRAST